MASKPNFMSARYISKDCILVFMKERVAKLNTPIYIGAYFFINSKITLFSKFTNTNNTFFQNLLMKIAFFIRGFNS